jgi:dihydroorotase
MKLLKVKIYVFLWAGSICVYTQRPGYEHKESLYSLEKAALAGGFSEIALLPNTKPTVQTRESVHYLRKSGDIIKFHPLAAVTLKCEGKDFTEMIDLHHAGAVAFTDGEHLFKIQIFSLKHFNIFRQSEAF